MNEVAMTYNIANDIPVGHENAVSRKWLAAKTGMSDRMVRKAIEDSPAPIINLGYGYFIPDENSEVDTSEKTSYIAQELARIQAITQKLSLKFGVGAEQ